MCAIVKNISIIHSINVVENNTIWKINVIDEVILIPWQQFCAEVIDTFFVIGDYTDDSNVQEYNL